MTTEKPKPAPKPKPEPEPKPTPEEEALDKEIAAMFAAAEAEVQAEEAAGAGSTDEDGDAAPRQTVKAADGTEIPLEPVSDAAKKEWAKLSGGAATTTAVPQGTPSKVSPAMQRFNLQVDDKSKKK